MHGNDAHLNLIIDTDAGIDDAEAILMALAAPNATVHAITTVTGNVGVEQVNRNVGLLLQTFGREVPLHAGAAHPLVEPWELEDPPFHLQDGLGDWDERPACEPKIEAEAAAVALVRMVNEKPGDYTLVTLGPMTNIALAVRLDPTFPQKVKRLVFMGGAYHAVGNAPMVTSEYNIYCDPEAAHIVLDAFPMATMVTWEATLNHPIPWDAFDRFARFDTPVAALHRGITAKILKRARQRPDGYLLPDPLAMAVTLRPELVLEREPRHVRVELQGQYSRGQTVVNYTWQSTGEPNVDIIKRIDVDGVVDLYEQFLGFRA